MGTALVNARAAAAAEALPPSTETFGIPACNPILISKLQRMDPALYKTITTKDTP